MLKSINFAQYMELEAQKCADKIEALMYQNGLDDDRIVEIVEASNSMYNLAYETLRDQKEFKPEYQELINQYDGYVCDKLRNELKDDVREIKDQFVESLSHIEFELDSFM